MAAHVDNVLAILGYDKSPACIRPTDAAFQRAPRVGHILRQAASELSLEAAYVLHPNPKATTARAPIPAVYVCSAKDEAAADELHRLIWNQDIAPFVVVTSPSGVKLYSGFRHQQSVGGEVEGQLSEFISLDAAEEVLRSLDATSIDSGALWQRRQDQVYWRHRLNRRLLANLLRVDELLQKDGLDQAAAHALIGRYVYLRYLRDRAILSDRKLERWGIDPGAVFGRDAKLNALAEVNQKLDDWLNGSVFPIKLGGRHGPKASHVRLVSGVFQGDDVLSTGDIQLTLDFQDYDFSHIPIETLSLVYEQFMHQGRRAEARAQGAYYTPIPVVNLMLSELEETHPLKRGMKVIDPSCGSGAFLVQAYRQLIEREYPPESKPKPGDLRELLERHIYGIDTDPDACNVTELSLVLTLLDYLDPPDLEDSRRNFKLPTLRNVNVFEANFFAEPSDKLKRLTENGFDWVVGNPPWKQLSESSLTDQDRPVWDWMKANEAEKPVGSNQAARAFVWKSGQLLNSNGKAALFIPSMTLYDNPSEAFRKQFFTDYDVSTIADLSNLAEVISDGRFRVPGAALFFEPGKNPTGTKADRESEITYYAPKVANQELTRPPQAGERVETWELLINGSEIRRAPMERAQSGDGLVWKTAMWGSHLDERLLRKVGKKFPSLGELEKAGQLLASEGLQLRSEGSESVKEIEEVVGRKTFDPKALSGLRNLFKFPASCLRDVECTFVRIRGGLKGLEVCRPPHVIVSAARNFAIYSEEFLIVPPRQIGIISNSSDKDFLKALSLYLSSDFALYHQFFRATEFGIKRPRANLKTLRTIPMPLENLSQAQRSEWSHLHRKLVSAVPASASGQGDLFSAVLEEDDSRVALAPLVTELNERVYDMLELVPHERSLIRDLLSIRLGLIDGKVEEKAIRQPTKLELKSYAQRLRKQLNDFLGRNAPNTHSVTVIPSSASGLVEITFLTKPSRSLAKVDERPSTMKSLDRLSQKLVKARNQWVYFNRNFRVYDGDRTLIMKPMQRFHWTETQATLDAQMIIAETLTSDSK